MGISSRLPYVPLNQEAAFIKELELAGEPGHTTQYTQWKKWGMIFAISVFAVAALVLVPLAVAPTVHEIEREMEGI